MMFFLACGYRVIAHDRRGHGRSTQTVNGNDMDTYAADVAIAPYPAAVREDPLTCATQDKRSVFEPARIVMEKTDGTLIERKVSVATV
jgi:hypothetical protein